jgi:hypothetical protein
MARQLNIRSDRAYRLAASLASRQGRPIAAVVEEALALYDAASGAPGARLERWKAQLETSRRRLNADPFEIDDLYDPDTGLPE